uniref:Envelope protein n=1 Tax=Marmota marmota marmota TaxID=9994 RepID=A0A8C5ZSZ2_MARMA
MEVATHPESAKDKTHSLLIFLALCFVFPIADARHPNQTVSQTWQVLSGTGSIIWKKTSAEYPLWAWWPTLEPDLCHLLAGATDFDGPSESEACVASGRCACVRHPIGCRDPRARAALRKASFYVCPRDVRTRSQAQKCGGHESYYCKSWGCETTGDAYWNPSSFWDLIQVKRKKQKDPPLSADSCRSLKWYGAGPCTAFTCNPLNITFTPAGKASKDWITGKQWGLRVYKTNYDPGVLFQIRLIVKTNPQPIGPNNILQDQKAPPPKKYKQTPSRPTSPSNTIRPTPSTPPTVPVVTNPTLPGSGERLMDLVKGGYQALNSTQPNLTESCWICLQASPPYYEGVAINGNFTYGPSTRCNWETGHRLTLPEVTGSGTCIGGSSMSKELCAYTATVSSSDPSKCLVPPTGLYWACNTGITPCVATAIFNQSKDFCVLVQIYPQLLYYSSEDFEGHFMSRTRFTREPISITLAVLLGAGVLAGVGTGAATLIEGPRQLGILETAIQQDLRAIDTSVTALEKSLTSLSEVVLQNRRGLDLLFLKEGGLCAALKENCCFYTDRTGVVRESMTKLRERLHAREKSLRGSQSWFESWYNKSPWLTTILSTVAGPLIILLLILTFGPCIFNKLMQFMKERLSVIQTMVLTQQYQIKHGYKSQVDPSPGNLQHLEL